MSVEYYLVCKKHKQKFWVCSDGISGPLNQLDSNKKLASFIVTHADCQLYVKDENCDLIDGFVSCDEMKWEEILDYNINGLIKD